MNIWIRNQGFSAVITRISKLFGSRTPGPILFKYSSLTSVLNCSMCSGLDAFFIAATTGVEHNIDSRYSFSSLKQKLLCWFHIRIFVKPTSSIQAFKARGSLPRSYIVFLGGSFDLRFSFSNTASRHSKFWLFSLLPHTVNPNAAPDFVTRNASRSQFIWLSTIIRDSEDIQQSKVPSVKGKDSLFAIPAITALSFSVKFISS